MSHKFLASLLVLSGVVLSATSVATAQSVEQRLQSAYEKGVAAYDQGQYAGALPQFEQAVVLAKQVLGKGTKGPLNINTARLMKRQADCLMELMRLAEAEQLYRSCSATGLAEEGQTSALHVLCLAQLGSIASRLHQLSKAEEYYRKVTLAADDPREKGIAHSNLAYLYWEQNKQPEALVEFKKSGSLYNGLNSDDKVKLLKATNQHGLGMIAFKQGQYIVAEGHFAGALEVRRKLLPPDHLFVAHSRGMLASVRSQLGRDIEAIEQTEQALRSLQAFSGKQHIDVAMELHELALLLNRADREQETAVRLHESRQIIRNYMGVQLASLSSEEQLKFTTDERSRFCDSMAIALRRRNSGQFAAAAYEWLLNDKSIIHETLAEQELLLRQSTNEPQIKLLVQKLDELRTRMVIADSSGKAASDPEILRIHADEAALRRQIGLSQTTTANERWTTTAELRAVLPPNTVLIDFVRIDRSEPMQSQFSAVPTNAQTRYMAFVLAQDSAPQLIDLGLAKDIDDRIDQLRSCISAISVFYDKQRSTSLPGDQTSAVLGDLAHLVWFPLKSYLGNRTSVLISPDGPLWLLPWCALPVNSESDRFLVEENQVTLLVSGRDLLRTSSGTPRSLSVIFANPDFNAGAASKQSSLTSLFRDKPVPESRSALRSAGSRGVLGEARPLPGTAIEAQAVQPSLTRFMGGVEPLKYTEGYALESAAKLLRSPRVALFSTHGYALPDAVRTASGGLGHPLLKCGLLLAGCNRSQEAVSGDDGILTGLEVCGIDFRDTELVVLSACESGLGSIHDGEGVSGLRQAFQLAGAKSVVSTLWQIPDAESVPIMSDFFSNLAAGDSRSLAMQRSQVRRIEVLREKRKAHPYLWAAWTVTGK